MMATAASQHSLASGNSPESNNCSQNKPYQAVCTNALHKLEGWYGSCRESREQAEQDAAQHVAEHHHGNSRYTGVRKYASR